MLPDYAGGSIANLPGSILQALNVQSSESPHMLSPLRPDIIDEDLLGNARVVIMLVVDGFGQENLAWARAGGAIEWLDSASRASVITSVFPSTTAAALTTLQTGLAPGQHGMAGYTLYLTPQNATINMITWKPTGGMQAEAELPESQSFLGVPNIYQRLQSAGVETSIVSNQAFADSPLTNLQSAGVPYSGHRTLAEMAGLLLQETAKPGRRFIYCYWDGFDTLAHTHGPESEITLNEAYLIDQAIGRGVLDPLASRGDGDILLLIVADHGQTAISRERVYSLKDVLRGRSLDRPIPTGERRAAGLPFDDPDGLAELRDLAGEDGVILSVADAVTHGLYGPADAHPDLLSRVGRTLLLARNDAAFLYPQSNNHTAGGHGSLTRREMLVPLLAWRF